MALQVTLFPNMGFSIGYAIHHVAMDEKSTAMFMHTWAYICRQGGNPTLTPELTPSYVRSSIKSQEETNKAYLQGWLDQGGPNTKSVKPWDFKAPEDTMYGTFVLPQESIEKIKKWVSKESQEKHKQDVGFIFPSYVIITAFVWVCLVRAQRLVVLKTSLVISLDCRAMLVPYISSTYFSNCVLFCIAEAKTYELEGEDAVVAALAIVEALKSLGKKVFDGAEEWVNRLFYNNTKGLYSVSDGSSYEYYKTDFGWGKAKKVDLASIRAGSAFSISDCRDADGGVEIGVALTQLEIEIFWYLFEDALKTL